MKRVISFLLGVMGALLLCAPILAQDLDPTVEGPVVQNIVAEQGGTINVAPPAQATTGTSTNSVPTPVVIAIAIVGLIAFIALMYNQQLIIKAVSPLVPPESAQAIVDGVATTVVSSVANMILPLIPGNIDDQALMTAMKQRGLLLARGEDGLYHTTRIETVSQPAPPTTNPYTTTSTPGP